MLSEYAQSHTHPVNRACHYVGIPLIVISPGLLYWGWPWALGAFVIGWIFQFVGHAFEGKPPAFFKNPLFLLVGPYWVLRKLVSRDRSSSGPDTP